MSLSYGRSWLWSPVCVLPTLPLLLVPMLLLLHCDDRGRNRCAMLSCWLSVGLEGAAGGVAPVPLVLALTFSSVLPGIASLHSPKLILVLAALASCNAVLTLLLAVTAPAFHAMLSRLLMARASRDALIAFFLWLHQTCQLSLHF